VASAAAMCGRSAMGPRSVVTLYPSKLVMAGLVPAIQKRRR